MIVILMLNRCLVYVKNHLTRNLSLYGVAGAIHSPSTKMCDLGFLGMFFCGNWVNCGGWQETIIRCVFSELTSIFSFYWCDCCPRRGMIHRLTSRPYAASKGVQYKHATFLTFLREIGRFCRKLQELQSCRAPAYFADFKFCIEFSYRGDSDNCVPLFSSCANKILHPPCSWFKILIKLILWFWIKYLQNHIHQPQGRFGFSAS